MQAKTKIAFTGDMSFSAFFQKGYQKNDLIDTSLLNFCNECDATVINYESPITPLKHTKKKRLAHRTDPEALDFIKKKFTYPILSFANNHMMDYKSIGFIDSIEETEKREIPFIGAGRNRDEASQYVIIGEETKVGILSVQYKMLRKLTKNFMGPLHESMIDDLQERITELRAQVDWIVLVYHGGDEFLHAPMPYTRKLIKTYLNMDIDIIVAHHPHVVQGYERLNGKLVFYSLGNFLFDSTYQRVQEGTDQGMLVRLLFSKDTYEFGNCPVAINREQFVVEKGVDSPFFIEITPKNYKRLWTYESARKPQVLENAKDLRVTELAEIKEQRLQQKLEHKERLEKVKLHRMVLEGYTMLEPKEENEDSLLSEEQIDDSAEQLLRQQKKQRRRSHRKTKRLVKRTLRKIFFEKQKNYRKWVLRVGRFMNKLFNRGRNVYQ